MPSPEHRGGEPAPEGEQPRYHQAARFAGDAPAHAVYRQAEATIFAVRGRVDLSTYRFQLDRIWHVAVLGEPPAEEIDQRLRGLFATGEPADLPAEVLSALHRRREEQKRIAPWVERHHRPGRRLT